MMNIIKSKKGKRAVINLKHKRMIWIMTSQNFMGISQFRRDE